MIFFSKERLGNSRNLGLRARITMQVKVFGSFATGLYLPTSDVDVSSFIYFGLIFLGLKGSKCYIHLSFG